MKLRPIICETRSNTCKDSTPPAKPEQNAAETCFTDMACPTADVSAYCRAVVAKVIPHGFWGGDGNKQVIMYWIDQFISLRRFESVSLHQVTQKIQVLHLFHYHESC